MRTCLVRGIAVVAVMLALIVPAYAQETTATITGVVTDDTGAVLPGVAIIAKHVPTGRTFEFVSTSTGAYSATLLPIGAYEVTFTLSGFQPLTIKGITLNVNDRIDVNGKLKVGGLAEVIEVRAETMMVQPTPAVQNLVDAKQVQELPLNNRNFVQLATLAPGVSSDLPDEVGIGLTSTVSISVNGSRRNAVNWLVDGVSNVDVGSNITLLSTPTLESIEQFKIITSSYAAEWPRSGGGIVNVITKSGSKKYMGVAYDFIRSDAFNANSWIRNRSTDPTVAGHPPKLDYQNFGYTFGGPVPKMSDKLFFFWSQEWRRITRAPASLTATVPDPTWLTDPTSTNYVDPSLRDPNAVKLLAAYPAPNVPGKNQYLVSSPNINNTRQEVIRMDYDLSSRWRLTGRYTHDLSQTRELGGLWNGIAIPNIATTETNVPGQVLALQLKTILSNNALNEFSYQKSGNVISTTNPSDTKGMRSDYGINIPELFPENLTNRIPGIAVSGLSTFNSMQLYHIEYVNHTFTDNFSLQRGNHAFKAGALMTFEQKNENAANVTQGSFSFVASTNPTRTAFQNFLLGNADGLCTACSYSEAERDVTNHLRFNRYEMYAQDTWRAQKNLTIDLGVRYSLYPPITDANNMLVTFDPSFYKAATAPQFTNAAGTLVDLSTGDWLDGLVIAGKNSPYGNGIYAFQKNSIQPRLGFSWDPKSSGNTIVRGAFGIYYDQPLVGIFEQNSFSSPPFVNNISLTGIKLSNPGAGVTGTTTGMRAIQATSLDFKNPRTTQWNVAITRRLFSKATIEVSYVGSRGDNLIRPTNPNFPQPADVVALQSTVASAVNAARPFRSYGTITMRETTAKSRYQGLLSAFRWQFGQSGTLSVNYTLSHVKTDSTNDRDAIDIPQNPANPMADYADARTDRRHIFSASYVYEIPFLRDSPNFALRNILGGWQVSGITYVNSGQPVPRMSVDVNNFRRGGFADLVGNPMVGMLSTNGTPPMWFNPAAFAPPADGTFGNSGRAPFRQPGFYKWDITLSKNFYLTKDVRLQFRADFINAFNQVNWASDPSATGLDNTCTTSITSCTVATDTFGQLIAVRAPREIQFGLKLFW
ncbi:MAG: carboxypeptidase regulatory-like domain-containing protein [Acidobacteria bacterium]|nr:carboxypeptidase regulatory-like domain-containing protein [Acidobacteriota bacterium]